MKTKYELKKSTKFFLIFIVVFVIQNSIFGWNKDPQSDLEAFTDILWKLPLIVSFLYLISEHIIDQMDAYIASVINAINERAEDVIESNLKNNTKSSHEDYVKSYKHWEYIQYLNSLKDE